jgi:hypothetical protein
MSYAINAKEKFREGFIMLTRPFVFAELKNPLQKFTILWAYAERPVVHEMINAEGREKLEEIEHSTPAIGFWGLGQREEWIAREIEKVYTTPKYKETHYEGEVVQAIIQGQICRFYPDEYTIIGPEKLTNIMQEEGYHTICDPTIYKLPDFRNKKHYLQSRGISERIATKWASVTFRDLVIYKPYYELLTMFCRDHEIPADPFYDEVEGISMEEQEERYSIAVKKRNLTPIFPIHLK